MRFGARRSWRAALLVVGVLMLVACGPTVPLAPQGGANDTPASPSQPGRALVIAIRAEPVSLARKVLASGIGTSYATTQRLFNAYLGVLDNQGAPRPYLADTLPKLDTDTWQVFADGGMETTYELKPNLTWHDGTPMAAEDFVFAWQVYSAPQVGIATASPQNLMAEVVAPDARTLVIRWKRPYPAASTLDEDNFPPLPRHLLQDGFLQDPEGLASQPYWTRDYVGLGPYRLSRWEPGSFIEGTAFDGHSLGRARIEHVRLVFIGDANTALANLLSGEAHFSTDSSIRFEQALILRQAWTPQRAGTVLVRPESFRGAWVQLRPQLASPRVLLDVRVRRALAHSLNRQSLNEGLFEGQGIMTEAPFIAPTASYFAEVDRAMVKYPYDLRVTEQLMAAAGFTKGPDGVYTSATEGRLHFEIQTLSATEREKEMAILANGWRQAGFDVSETVLPATRAADNQARATFPAMFTYSTSEGEYSLAGINSAAIGTAENRWIGTNRGGWSNEEFDRAVHSFRDAVAPTERVQSITQMARVFTEDLPAIPLLFDLRVYAHAAALRGPQSAAQETPIAWNVYEWEFQ